MIVVPPGLYTMGSPATEADRSPNEGPQHEVEITRPFYMGAYEVTQAEWEKVKYEVRGPLAQRWLWLKAKCYLRRYDQILCSSWRARPAG
jgi:formylglycine-generating enzyme required for sulfatase activity